MAKRVPYLNKDFGRSTDRETMVKWYSLNICDTYTKRYHTAFAALAALTPLQRNLLDYACERMGLDNIVENNVGFKRDFNAAISTAKKKSTPPTVSTVPSAHSARPVS